jgi:hypothetical protein
MKHTLFAALVAAAVTTSACAGFEQTSTTLAPSGESVTSTSPSPSAAPSSPASLLGTWSSNPIAGIAASSCGGFSWQVTSQTPTSLSGTFTATCANGISATGTASGQINGSDVPYTVSGTATVPGIPACPFTLSGTARIEDSDTLRIPYSGSTCLGPLQGEETLRRPSQPEPAPAPAPGPEPAPEPAPAPPAAPAENPNHVGPGPQSMARAEQVVFATADEFPHLVAAYPTSGESIAAAEQLLLRMIWHLQLAGFDAARQKNPSGAISNDKLNVFADGRWRVVDVFYDYGAAGRPTKVIFFEIEGSNPIPDGGIPD